MAQRTNTDLKPWKSSPNKPTSILPTSPPPSNDAYLTQSLLSETGTLKPVPWTQPIRRAFGRPRTAFHPFPSCRRHTASRWRHQARINMCFNLFSVSDNKVYDNDTAWIDIYSYFVINLCCLKMRQVTKPIICSLYEVNLTQPWLSSGSVKVQHKFEWAAASL